MRAIQNKPNKAITGSPARDKLPTQEYTLILKGSALKSLGDITRDLQLVLEEFSFSNNLGLSIDIRKLEVKGK